MVKLEERVTMEKEFFIFESIFRTQGIRRNRIRKKTSLQPLNYRSFVLSMVFISIELGSS